MIGNQFSILPGREVKLHCILGSLKIEHLSIPFSGYSKALQEFLNTHSTFYRLDFANRIQPGNELCYTYEAYFFSVKNVSIFQSHGNRYGQKDFLPS